MDQQIEGLRELSLGVVAVHPDAREESLVQQSAFVVAGTQIGIVTMLQEVQCLGQGSVEITSTGTCNLFLLLNDAEAGSNPVLLLLQLVKRYGTGVVRLQQLGALIEKTVPVAGEAARVLFGFLGKGGEVTMDGLLDGGAMLWTNLNAFI